MTKRSTTYSRAEIESKLRVLAVSGDPRARELASSIRAQLDELNADAEPPGLIESQTSPGSFRVTSRADVAAARAMLREGKATYGTKQACPGRSR